MATTLSRPPGSASATAIDEAMGADWERWYESLPADERAAFDEMSEKARHVANDTEAQHVAADVAADLQLVLADLISQGDVVALERFAERLGFASMDDALALARKRQAKARGG
jgi:hypothetical protein